MYTVTDRHLLHVSVHVAGCNVFQAAQRKYPGVKVTDAGYRGTSQILLY
ncbi:MAG: hypothetical protein P857_1092 [Candidatus Xenolissoclinum pacificiensis L6]|uniref:Uncharacterized protein n=1 Tax=Candidatus Xenolissoclinum pacificiensis L6 TaxID=1401685 RepID=W2V2M3_9RICK|nr:MAG: hypothetical protein P857_1092 [Candidatus Xenolissoclinum pacificiensis L6]